MKYLLLVAAVVSLAASEKLGNIEVITRDQLGDGQLQPPDKEAPIQANDEDVSLRSANLLNFARGNQENKFIPPPALSYLPPVKTPLPIESTAAPFITPAIKLETDYLPPGRGVAGHIRPVVEPPNGLYAAPNPQPAAEVSQPVISPQYNTQIHSTQNIPPVAVQHGPPVPLAGLPDDYYLEDEQPGFLSHIRDSKESLLGGIVGAKAAVLTGLRNAGDSIYSGVTGALSAKAAAFSSLKGEIGGFKGTNEAQSTYGAVQNGYGSNPSVGIAGTNTANSYPLPVPDPPAPAPAPVTPVPIYVPLPVSPYPAYPPYPPNYQGIPVYAAPVPIYRPAPNPLAKLKAKIEGIVQAKKDAVAGAIARVDAFKAGIRQKIDGFLNKDASKPAYHSAFPEVSLLKTKPTYSTLFHKEPSPSTMYQTRPNYHSYYFDSGNQQEDQRRKPTISGAISRLVRKLKSPFQPRYRYGYRQW